MSLGQARAIISTAEKEAEQIINQAKSKARGIEEAALHKTQIFTENLNKKLREEYNKKLNKLDDKIYHYIKLIAEEVLSAELRLQPQSILNRINKTLKQLARPSELKIIVPNGAAKYFNNSEHVQESSLLTRGQSKIEMDNYSLELYPSKHLERLFDEATR